MKKTKILVPALGILCLSMAASVTSTFAWFASNNIVTAKGMKVYSTTPASLVIGKTVPVGYATEVNFGNETTAETDPGVAPSELSPCTHDAGQTSGLKFISAGGEYIDPNTGWLVSGKTESDLTYSNAAAETHFVDFTVYIASAGDAINDKDLSVALSNATTVTADTLMACSVDYYVNASAHGGIGSYVGTLNLAGKDSSVNDGTTAKTTLKLLDTTVSGQDIPSKDVASETRKAIRVDMRIYFDGNLNKTVTGEACQKYVYTNEITTTQLALVSTFTIGAHAGA